MALPFPAKTNFSDWMARSPAETSLVDDTAGLNLAWRSSQQGGSPPSAFSGLFDLKQWAFVAGFQAIGDALGWVGYRSVARFGSRFLARAAQVVSDEAGSSVITASMRGTDAWGLHFLRDFGEGVVARTMAIKLLSRLMPAGHPGLRFLNYVLQPLLMGVLSYGTQKLGDEFSGEKTLDWSLAGFKNHLIQAGIMMFQGQVSHRVRTQTLSLLQKENLIDQAADYLATKGISRQHTAMTLLLPVSVLGMGIFRWDADGKLVKDDPNALPTPKPALPPTGSASGRFDDKGVLKPLSREQSFARLGIATRKPPAAAKQAPAMQVIRGGKSLQDSLDEALQVAIGLSRKVNLAPIVQDGKINHHWLRTRPEHYGLVLGKVLIDILFIDTKKRSQPDKPRYQLKQLSTQDRADLKDLLVTLHNVKAGDHPWQQTFIAHILSFANNVLLFGNFATPRQVIAGLKHHYGVRLPISIDDFIANAHREHEWKSTLFMNAPEHKAKTLLAQMGIFFEPFWVYLFKAHHAPPKNKDLGDMDRVVKSLKGQLFDRAEQQAFEQELGQKTFSWKLKPRDGEIVQDTLARSGRVLWLVGRAARSSDECLKGFRRDIAQMAPVLARGAKVGVRGFSRSVSRQLLAIHDRLDAWSKDPDFELAKDEAWDLVTYYRSLTHLMADACLQFKELYRDVEGDIDNQLKLPYLQFKKTCEDLILDLTKHMATVIF